MDDLNAVVTRQAPDLRGGQALGREADDLGTFELLLGSWNAAHRSSSGAPLLVPLNETSGDRLNDQDVNSSAHRKVLELISAESRCIAEEIANLQARLIALEAGLVQARRREREAALSVLRELLERYELSPSEILQPEGLAFPQGAATSSPLSRGSSTPLGNENSPSKPVGKSWCGRGRHPRWLKQMLAAGHQLSEFSARQGAATGVEVHHDNTV